MRLRISTHDIAKHALLSGGLRGFSLYLRDIADNGFYVLGEGFGLAFPELQPREPCELLYICFLYHVLECIKDVPF